MKTLIIATVLLVLMIPATASANRIKEKDWKLAYNLGEMYFLCHKYSWPEGEAGNREATCDAYDMLQKALEDKGYCVVGQGAVGRPGGRMKPEQATVPGQRHCYIFTDWDKH